MDMASNQHHNESKLRQRLASLASGTAFKQHPFLPDGFTFEQLYGRAAIIRDQIERNPDRSIPLCLCSGNIAQVAAALLATLGSGSPPLLMPYAHDKKTLQQARKSIHFTSALVEKACELPEGVTGFALPETDNLSCHLNEQASVSLDAPWIYLFTGGSTGKPRIWSKTPRNLLMEALYLKKTFQISSKDTILATVPANHIYGLLYSVLLPLVSGACVNPDTPSYPNEIIQCLQATQATVLVSIPAHYRALKAHPIEGHHVRTAFSSAGALAEKDSLDFYHATGIAITEIYGSTETGGIARRTRGRGQTTLEPFECVQFQIKNEHLRVRSAFLSKELDKTDNGFFETADRAAWQQPSGFVLLGRSDGVVKVGGKRVDLAGTREVLMQVHGVRDAYVFAIPVQSGRENEIAALVEGRVSEDQIIQATHLHLPSYARPRSVKITRKIPLSPTGKYNREAIKKLFER